MFYRVEDMPVLILLQTELQSDWQTEWLKDHTDAAHSTYYNVTPGVRAVWIRVNFLVILILWIPDLLQAQVIYALVSTLVDAVSRDF